MNALQSERLAVMDELCEYLSEIPPADISAFFKPGATFVQKRLALRYMYILLSMVIVSKMIFFHKLSLTCTLEHTVLILL